MENVKILNLDVDGIESISEFLEKMGDVLGSPTWHGNNVNAFIDSILGGGINRIKPPFTLVVNNISALSDKVGEEILNCIELLDEVFAEEGRTDVRIEVR